MSDKSWGKSAIVYLCATFFVITLLFIYMSFRGEPQAGLIEVGASSALFVIFLVVTRKILPQSANVISNIISILLAIIFISANYYLQVSENKNAALRDLLIGDLIVKKIVGDDYENGVEYPASDLINNLPSREFERATTEKYTIESAFERPEKMDQGSEPAWLPLEPSFKTASVDVKESAIDKPLHTVIYKLQTVSSEKPLRDTAKAMREPLEGFVGNGQIYARHFAETIEAPVDTPQDFKYVYDKNEKFVNQAQEAGYNSLPRENYILSPTTNLLGAKMERP